MTDTPKAIVREIDGQLVLDDPDAVALFRAVAKSNCQHSLRLNADRVSHFKTRVRDKGLTADDVVIVLLNMDDPNGAQLGEALMPGYNWQEIRDRGEIPFARGLAGRDGIQNVLNEVDPEAAEKLQNMKDIAVMVMDHGVAEVFPA